MLRGRLITGPKVAVRAVVAIALVAVAGTVTSGSAFAEAKPGIATSAEPSSLGLPHGFSSWKQLFDAQEPLDRAATRIEEAASVNAASGFTSDAVDAATGWLTVYWHGQPTASERAALDAVRAQGTKVRVIQAKYSKIDLDAQVALIEQDAVAGGPERVTHITKLPDGSGIEVGVASKATSTQGPAASSPSVALGNELPHVQAAKKKVDIKIVPGPGAGSRALSREADSSPFWGGAVVWHDQSSYCSSGFAVHWYGDDNDYMTTAAHCGGVGNLFYNGDFSHQMGVGTAGNAGYDLMFIRTPSAGVIYTGPPAYSAGQGSMPVKSASHTHIGDSLCTGGAATGWHCYIRASGPTQNCDSWVAPVGLGNCFSVEGGITTIPGQLIIGKGDSGGPVWTPINGFGQPNSAADARGLISSLPDGWPWIPCGNDPVVDKPNTCGTAVWFTDIVSAIQPWVSNGGMYVKTM